MIRKLLIRDLTLRDGQQSILATRMSQKQIDRVLPYYREAGFFAVEVWGGAVPDAIMRYLGEDPWERLEKIKATIGNTTRLAALSRGRNLFGYNPYSDEIIEGFCRNSIQSGVDIMRIFDALNDVDNMKSTIRYVKKYGGKADCAVCYAIDPHHSAVERIRAALNGHPLHKPVFTNEYFLDKALQMENQGADIITLKDMSGLIPPCRTTELIRLFKKNLKVPVDFHTHCTPGYGLASMVAAIVNGVDIVDTAVWNFAGGTAAPAVELIYIFCKKMGIELELDMEAIAQINVELLPVRKELSVYDRAKKLPKPFNPLVDSFPAEIDRFFNDAIEAARKDKEDDLLLFCRAIEEYFDFPEPDELVRKAQIPERMYTSMVAQLKQLGKSDLLEKAMSLIPEVRMDAGLPPLVTPTSQIIAEQAVWCALDEQKGQPLYSHLSNQFIALIKGEYGRTPVPIDPAFRLEIAGVKKETPYDGSAYVMQENPLVEPWGAPLAENEKEVLLLELFPAAARTFLSKKKDQPRQEPLSGG